MGEKTENNLMFQRSWMSNKSDCHACAKTKTTVESAAQNFCGPLASRAFRGSREEKPISISMWGDGQSKRIPKRPAPSCNTLSIVCQTSDAEAISHPFLPLSSTQRTSITPPGNIADTWICDYALRIGSPMPVCDCT